MASLLTDDVRREQNAVFRAQRIKCEKIFNVCGFFLILTALADLVGTILWSAFGLITSTNLAPAWCFPVSLAVYVLVLTGTFGRKMPTVLIGALIGAARLILNPIGFFTLSAIPILIICLTMRKWVSLSKEEGFPLFDISFDEREKRAAQMERITKHVAIETGKRRTAVPDAGEMSDLLDAAGDVPVATAELSGYHDRSRHGSIVESGRTVENGNMDEL